MQEATEISDPDYGVIFDDMVYENGAEIEHARYPNVQIEVEFVFVLSEDLSGPGTRVFDVLDANRYVVLALKTLDSCIEREALTIVDTISDNAAMGRHDLRW